MVSESSWGRRDRQRGHSPQGSLDCSGRKEGKRVVCGRGEGGRFGSERGGVGEGEKPKLEGLTGEEMIRAKMQGRGEGPRMEGRTGWGGK